MRYLPLLLLFAACRTVPPSTTNVTFDSTMVTNKARIDTIWLAGEVIEVPGIQIECDSVTNKPKPVEAVVKGKRMVVRSSINKKGLLTTRASCDSLMQVVTLQDKEIFRLRHENKTITLPPVVSHSPWWFDVLFRWWALISGLVLVWRYRGGLLSVVKKVIN